MYAKTRAIAQKFGAKIAVGTTALMVAGMSHAAGLDDIFDAIDLSGISAKVLALGLLIVGIALIMKGPSIAKRIIGKI